MKYGVFSVSLPEYNPEESVAVLKEMGYDAIEWRVAEEPKEVPEEIPFERRYWLDNKSTLRVEHILEDAKKAKALCEDAGIDIIALTTYLPIGDAEKLTKVCEAAKEIGCHQVRAGLVPYDPAKAEKPYPELFAELRSNLKALEPMLIRTEVKLVLEIHMDTLIASPSAAYRALEGFDPEHYGLIFDPGNMVNEGFEDYQKSFELLGDYIAHIHIKNGILEQDGEDEFGALKWKRTWTPLRKGMANLKHLFEIMHQMGYDGTISMEDFSNEASTKDKLTDNLIYVKQLAEATKQP